MSEIRMRARAHNRDHCAGTQSSVCVFVCAIKSDERRLLRFGTRKSFRAKCGGGVRAQRQRLRRTHKNDINIGTYVLRNCSLSIITILRDALAESMMKSVRISLVVAGGESL